MSWIPCLSREHASHASNSMKNAMHLPELTRVRACLTERRETGADNWVLEDVDGGAHRGQQEEKEARVRVALTSRQHRRIRTEGYLERLFQRTYSFESLFRGPGVRGFPNWADATMATWDAPMAAAKSVDFA
jgi:hypothetical protein